MPPLERWQFGWQFGAKINKKKWPSCQGHIMLVRCCARAVSGELSGAPSPRRGEGMALTHKRRHKPDEAIKSGSQIRHKHRKHTLATIKSKLRDHSNETTGMGIWKK
jgi:hypothetical protein